MSNPQPINLKSLSVVNDSDLKVRSKLAEYRKARGYSQDDLAKLTGLTKTTIQNWENGRNLGAVMRVLRVCRELDVDVRDLFAIESN